MTFVNRAFVIMRLMLPEYVFFINIMRKTFLISISAKSQNADTENISNLKKRRDDLMLANVVK